MSVRLLLAADDSLPAENLDRCFELCSDLATVIGEPVYLAALDSNTLDDLRAWVLLKTAGAGLESAEPRTTSFPAAANSNTTFIYRDDGRPDWPAMCRDTSDLALYGGPPHRDPGNPIEAPEAESDDFGAVSNDVVAELRRGIFETTGLFSEPAPPSQLAVTCSSKRMAAWMSAAIILENVYARCEDELLYLHANPTFELTDHVRIIITVIAKTHRYWQTHVIGQ
jgi:hypothetical protein